MSNRGPINPNASKPAYCVNLFGTSSGPETKLWLQRELKRVHEVDGEILRKRYGYNPTVNAFLSENANTDSNEGLVSPSWMSTAFEKHHTHCDPFLCEERESLLRHSKKFEDQESEEDEYIAIVDVKKRPANATEHPVKRTASANGRRSLIDFASVRKSTGTISNSKQNLTSNADTPKGAPGMKETAKAGKRSTPSVE